MKVPWDDDIPNLWENLAVMFQSPPTSVSMCHTAYVFLATTIYVSFPYWLPRKVGIAMS